MAHMQLILCLFLLAETFAIRSDSPLFDEITGNDTTGCLCNAGQLEAWLSKERVFLEQSEFTVLVARSISEITAESTSATPEVLTLKAVSKMLMSVATKAGTETVTALAIGAPHTLISAAAWTDLALSSMSANVLTLPLTLGLLYVQNSLSDLRHRAEMTKSLPRDLVPCAVAFADMTETLSGHLLDVFAEDMSSMQEFFSSTGSCSWRPTASWGLFGADKWLFDPSDFDMWSFFMARMMASYTEGFKVCEASREDKRLCSSKLLGDPDCIKGDCPKVWKAMLTTDFEHESNGFGKLNKYRFAHQWMCKQDGKAVPSADSQLYIKRYLQMFSCQYDAWRRKSRVSAYAEEIAGAISTSLRKLDLDKLFVENLKGKCQAAKIYPKLPDTTTDIVLLAIRQMVL